ncbi:radical SAM protein [candidate division KSB1 bacterium]|nr:radical SAM protein [candidate division KSB1 bacterium]
MVKSHYLQFFIRWLEFRILKHTRPLLASFKITHRCNLQCRTCPFWRNPLPDISYENAIAVMHKLHRDGIRLLIFEGGEPMIWKDGDYRLTDLVIYARKKFLRVGITTNGMLPPDVPADMIWVSLDGWGDVHDQNRGKSFGRVMTNIQNSQHPHMYVNLTINRLNVDHIAEFIRNIGTTIRGITIQFYYPFPGSDDLSLSSDQRVAVLEQLIELKRGGAPLLNSFSTLSDLKANTWRCHPWLIASAEPDGKISKGCYLKNRAAISCHDCGFAAHTEISKAFDLNIGAILAGHRIFQFRIL